MPRTRGPYPAEFRRRIIEVARAGRSVAELAKEFEPSYWTIRQWIKQADRDEGRSAEGLSTAEREELGRLRKENRQLKQEREILSKAAAWFARETDSVPPKSFEFVSGHQAKYPIATMCRVLEVSTSGYYAWRRREPSA